MKVLAFNGSPRMKKGVTDSLVNTFLEGAASAGAQTEMVYVSKGTIPTELQDAAAAPLISFEEFVRRSNALFKKLIAEYAE